MSSQLMKRKPIADMLDQTNKTELARVLSALDLTLLGIGAIIGTGIFVLTGVVAATTAGPAILLSFVVAGLACIFAAFCYAEFASTVPISGSAYTYTYATMGEIFAFLLGWDLMLEYLLAVSAVANGWSAYFQSLFSGFGIVIPTALASAPGAGKGGVVDICAIIIILIVGGVLCLGVKESATVNNIMVAVKLVVVLLFIFVGMKYVKPENWQPFMPFGFQGVIGGAATVFFAYLGFDAVSTAAEEVKNPQRDLPIGIIASLSVCTILYIVVSAILTGIVPYTELNVSNPVAFALQYIGQNWIAGIISLGAIMGITTVLLVMSYGSVRILFAMSRDGLLPKFLSDVHPKYKTPILSTLAVACVAGGFAGFVDLGTLAHLVNIGTLSAFVLVSAAVLILRKSEPDLPRAFKVPAMPLIPILAIVMCGYLMLNLPLITWQLYFVWLGIGTIVYFAYAKGHSNLNEKNIQKNKQNK